MPLTAPQRGCGSVVTTYPENHIHPSVFPFNDPKLHFMYKLTVTTRKPVIPLAMPVYRTLPITPTVLVGLNHRVISPLRFRHNITLNRTRFVIVLHFLSCGPFSDAVMDSRGTIPAKPRKVFTSSIVMVASFRVNARFCFPWESSASQHNKQFHRTRWNVALLFVSGAAPVNFDVGTHSGEHLTRTGFASGEGRSPLSREARLGSAHLQRSHLAPRTSLMAHAHIITGEAFRSNIALEADWPLRRLATFLVLVISQPPFRLSPSSRSRRRYTASQHSFVC